MFYIDWLGSVGCVVSFSRSLSWPTTEPTTPVVFPRLACLISDPHPVELDVAKPFRRRIGECCAGADDAGKDTAPSFVQR